MPSVREAHSADLGDRDRFPRQTAASVASLPQENLLPNCRCGFVENGDRNNPKDPRFERQATRGRPNVLLVPAPISRTYPATQRASVLAGRV